MKVIIPQELKSDVPQSVWGKILSATPVVMAVVATMLAGLASSEMTRAQYARSLAAQQQSKAGDQWSFFQAKRLRGAIQRNTVDLLQNIVSLRPATSAALKTAVEQTGTSLGQPNAEQQVEVANVRRDLLALIDSPAGQQALSLMEKGELPPLAEGPPLNANIKAALDAVERLEPEDKVALLLAKVSDKMLEEAVVAARDRAQDFDTATKPVNQAIDQVDTLLSRQAAAVEKAKAQPADSVSPSAAATLCRDFTAARLRFAALRYEVEARLNQAVANIYELQVRKSNISAQRHHARSQRFFFGMLGAQLGVIISTFALAAKKRNLLWGLAAGAGLIAIAFAIYVYLYV